MSQQGGDRVDGAEFKAWRKRLGIEAGDLHSFTRVSLRTIFNFESGKPISEPLYWALHNALKRVEDGGRLVIELRRHVDQGGRAVVSRLPAEEVGASEPARRKARERDDPKT